MKLRIKIYLIFPLCLLSYLSYAQQDPLFSQYMNNPVSINPAYAGSKGMLNITTLARQQWVGIDGAPETLSLSVNSPFKVYNVGVGLSLIYDVIGPVKQTGLYADYAYHLEVSNKSKLSFGLKGGFNLYDYNLLSLRGSENDELIALQGDRNMFLPNFGLGVFYYSDKHYLGLSAPKLIKNSLSDDKSTQNVINYEEIHYFLMGGMILGVSDFIKFKPSFITRFVSGSPFSAELSGAFIFHDKLLLGLMYRFEDSFGALFSIQLSPQLKIGYAYDGTHSRLGKYNSGTHEIMLSYDLKFGHKKTLSPRFF
ncbi:PorP/SprF family type IX secretion system membrane protein [Sunxiuqinia sp. A32]|uniref:PorP/SprF family type IX secretion system membrane protein n=1 Tax=Sunxiuqinia sp. A32 TaxID=3461496 RepID=UPI0040461AD5